MSPSSLYNTVTASEVIYRFMQGFLGYFVPCFLERAFQRLNWIMGWSTSICFQNGSNIKFHLIQVWWWERPNLLAPEMRTMILAPLLSFVGHVWWCTVSLECERLLLELFLSLCKARSQNCLNVRNGIDFSALWNKNERRLPCFGNSGPHHDKGRFMAPENL